MKQTCINGSLTSASQPPRPPQQLFPWYARTVSVSAPPAERMSDVKPHAAPLTTAPIPQKSTQCAASQATAKRHSQEPHFFAHGQHGQGI
jgi:hypothetical protein